MQRGRRYSAGNSIIRIRGSEMTENTIATSKPTIFDLAIFLACFALVAIVLCFYVESDILVIVIMETIALLIWGFCVCVKLAGNAAGGY